MVEVHFRADLQSEQYPEDDFLAIAHNLARMFRRVETALIAELGRLEAIPNDPALKLAAKTAYEEELRAFRLLYHNFSVEVK